MTGPTAAGAQAAQAAAPLQRTLPGMRAPTVVDARKPVFEPAQRALQRGPTCWLPCWTADALADHLACV